MSIRSDEKSLGKSHRFFVFLYISDKFGETILAKKEMCGVAKASLLRLYKERRGRL